MKYLGLCLFLGPTLFLPSGTRGDEAEDAAAMLQAVLPKAEALTIEGRYDESQELILRTFPGRSRTPVQTLMLANVFFKQNPENSYALHKQAALALPKNASVQFEWAMEQHRAREYAAAADSYAKVFKLGARVAGIYGLQAECLLRTGKTKEAAEAWRLSEEARGSLEDLETWVCDVNGHLFPDRDRAKLLPKAAAGDIVAARDLIALDVAFRSDWWNDGPNARYLAHDLTLLRKTKFDDQPRLRQILCMGDCAAAEDNAKADCLRKAGLLIDAKGTLPHDGIVVSSLLNSAISCGAVSQEVAKAKWNKVIWEKAKAAKDAELFNIVARFNIGSDKMIAIDRIAWQATGDERFAASLVDGLAQSKHFSPDDAEVKQITQKVPENWVIAQVVVNHAIRNKLPLEVPLVAAIKAEYTHFSLNGPLSPRPGANGLRRYFALLSKTVASGGK
jgi:hypothetical protein